MKNVPYFTALMLSCSLMFTSCQNTDDISVSLHQESNSLSKSVQGKKAGSDCARIQDGTIIDDNGETIAPGFNEQGYNYQARTYSGELYPEDFPGWNLQWKWNDAYLSTQDCDGDNLLDIANGQDSYRGTGAWTTTKWTSTYTGSDGNQCTFSQFSKFVAVPENATSDGELFYDADGNVIGQVVESTGFEDFARTQLIINNPCQGVSGIDFKVPGPVGLGNR